MNNPSSFFNRLSAISMYSGFNSNPMYLRLNFRATMPVVPEPINGSSTIPFSGHPAKNAVSHQFFGERRKMRFLQGLCRDCPYVSFVPKFPVDICVAAFCPVKLFGGRRVFVPAVSRCIRWDCAACYGLFMDSLTVEVILRGFGEQEDIFMGFRTPVFHAFRHGVRLRPNNILPQKTSRPP